MRLRTLLALVFVSLGILMLFILGNSLISRKRGFELGAAEAQKYYSYQ